MRKQLLRVALVLGLAAVFPAIATAQYSSSNYKVVETFIGGGGELFACSTGAFCAKQAIGETAVGKTTSNSFSAQSGFNTNTEELLEVDVNGGTFDLGLLDPTQTKAISATFSIRSYISSGYIVKIVGRAPTLQGEEHTLDSLPAAAFSTIGVEQFGMNLRLNTDPPIGADPVQVPDNTFSFGTYSTGYDQVDKFKYIDGDTVAYSASSSGKTIYTLTMIANISTTTQAGQYSAYFYVVAVPTF